MYSLAVQKWSIRWFFPLRMFLMVVAYVMIQITERTLYQLIPNKTGDCVVSKHNFRIQWSLLNLHLNIFGDWITWGLWGSLLFSQCAWLIQARNRLCIHNGTALSHFVLPVEGNLVKALHHCKLENMKKLIEPSFFGNCPILGFF